MRSQTYSQLTRTNPVRGHALASEVASPAHPRRATLHLPRRLELGLALAAVVAGAWATWGVASWLLTDWVLR